jgi:WD40 repeat protein
VQPLLVQTESPIYSAALSPRGDQFATAGKNGLVAVWRATNGELLVSIGLDVGIQDLTFTADATGLLAAGKGKLARVWDLQSEAPQCQPVKLDSECGRVVVSANGLVAVHGTDEVCRIGPLDADSSHLLAVRHPGGINSATFNRSGTILITAGRDRTVRRWCTATGRPVGPPLVHTESVWQAMWGDAEETTILTSSSGTIRRWKQSTVSPPADNVSAWARAWTGCEIRSNQDAVELTVDRWKQSRERVR